MAAVPSAAASGGGLSVEPQALTEQQTSRAATFA
jgi:hypothetical protein